MFHDLRPTFATTALQNGVDVKTVFPFWDTTTPGLPCAPAPIPRGKNRVKWPIPLSLACILRSAARKRAYYLLFETFFLSLSLLFAKAYGEAHQYSWWFFPQNKAALSSEKSGFCEIDSNLDIFQILRTVPKFTQPAFWLAALLRRTNVLAEGQNLGAGQLYFA